MIKSFINNMKGPHNCSITRIKIWMTLLGLGEWMGSWIKLRIRYRIIFGILRIIKENYLGPIPAPAPGGGLHGDSPFARVVFVVELFCLISCFFFSFFLFGPQIN